MLQLDSVGTSNPTLTSDREDAKPLFKGNWIVCWKFFKDKKYTDISFWGLKVHSLWIWWGHLTQLWPHMRGQTVHWCFYLGKTVHWPCSRPTTKQRYFYKGQRVRWFWIWWGLLTLLWPHMRGQTVHWRFYSGHRVHFYKGQKVRWLWIPWGPLTWLSPLHVRSNSTLAFLFWSYSTPSLVFL